MQAVQEAQAEVSSASRHGRQESVLQDRDSRRRHT